MLQTQKEKGTKPSCGCDGDRWCSVAEMCSRGASARERVVAFIDSYLYARVVGICIYIFMGMKACVYVIAGKQ